MKLHIEVAQQQWDLKKNLHNLLEQGLLNKAFFVKQCFKFRPFLERALKRVTLKRQMKVQGLLNACQTVKSLCRL